MTIFKLHPVALSLAAVISFQALADHSVEHIQVTGQQFKPGLSLDTNELEDLSPDLRDSLSALPGMAINTNGPVSAIAQYRGLFGDRVSVKLDGAAIAAAGPNAMDAPLSHVNTANVPQIKVYRGIAPVSAGAETIGGAIEVQANYDQFTANNVWQVNGNLRLSAIDNGDQRFASGKLVIANQDAFASFSAQDQKGDNLEDGDGREIPSTFYSRDNLQFEAGWRAGKHQVNLSVASKDTDASGTAALAMDIDYIDADWYRLAYQYQMSQDNQLLVRLYANDNEHGMNNFAYRSVMSPAMARTNTVDSEGKGLDVHYSGAVQDINYLLGFETFLREHNSRITNPNNGMFFIQNFNQLQRDSSSVFAEMDWQLDADQQLILGVRWTQVESEAGVVGSNMVMMNPNVATLVRNFNQADKQQEHDLLDVTAIWSLNASEQLKWVVGLGHKQKAPSYNELYSWFPLGVSAGLADGRNYIGNLELKEETAYQLDFGLDYTALDNSWFISPRVFYQRIDDYIQGVATTAPEANMIAAMMGAKQPLQWSNTDAALYGLDVQAVWQINSQLRWDSSLSYVRGERKDIDDDLYRIAPLSLHNSLSWKSNNWRVTGQWQLVAQQNQVSSTQDEQKSAGYGVVNLNLGYQLSSTLLFNLGIKNLLDKQYSPHLAGVNRVMMAEVARGTKLPEAGRSVHASVSFNF